MDAVNAKGHNELQWDHSKFPSNNVADKTAFCTWKYMILFLQNQS